MGIIEKQSIKGTLFIYLGAVAGFATTILMPNFFDADKIGLLSILVAYAGMIAHFSTLGFINVTTKIFPYFRNRENGHNGFIFLSSIVGLIGLVLLLLIFFLFKGVFLSGKDGGSTLFLDNIIYIIPLSFFFLFFFLYDSLYRSLFNATIGLFLKDLFQKILIVAALGVYYLGVMDFSDYLLFFVALNCLPTVIIIFALIKDKEFNLRPQFKFITPELRKDITSVAFFGILTALSGSVINYIDRIMIEAMMPDGLTETGIYSIAFSFGLIIILPSRAVLKISSAVIAECWKNDNRPEILSIYRKTSLNQMIIGSLLLIGIWANIDNIFQIIPKNFEAGKYVILLIGLAYLFDMATGAGTFVLSTSSYYRLQSFLFFGFIFLVILTNYFFISLYGILGAAIGSALSKLIFNLVRFIIIVVKLKMQPYNNKFLIVIAISVVTYLIGFIIPVFDFFIIDIIVRSAVISVVFLISIYLLKVSEEINQKIDGILAQIAPKK